MVSKKEFLAATDSDDFEEDKGWEVRPDQFSLLNRSMAVKFNKTYPRVNRQKLLYCPGSLVKSCQISLHFSPFRSESNLATVPF